MNPQCFPLQPANWLFLAGTNIRPGNPFAHLGKRQRPPSDIFVENVHFELFNRYLCIGEHIQSDLDIFRFDFMFVKPRDVPPMVCLNMQTDMRFYNNSSWHQTFYSAYPLETRAVAIKNVMSVCTLKQNIGGTSCGFTNMKSNQNMHRSDWKCSPLHTFRLNQSKWTFSTWISEGWRCIYPR